MTDANEPTYSVSDVASALKVSRRTVLNWIEAGHLPGSRKKGLAKNSPIIIPAKSVSDLRQKLAPRT